MLEHAAVSLVLDVLQVFARRPPGGIVLTHVAEPPRELRQPLAIAAVALPLDRQMLGFGEIGAREHGDLRLVVETLVGGRDESCGHEWERLGIDDSEAKVTAAASGHPMRCRRADRDEAGRMRARVRRGPARPVPGRGRGWAR